MPMPCPTVIRTFDKKSIAPDDSRCTVWWDKKGRPVYCLIRIARGIGFQRATAALVHEWAHGHDIAINGYPKDDHRQSFWRFQKIAYDIVYEGEDP